MPKSSPTQQGPDPHYDRDAIFDENGPFPPAFVNEAVRALMRALPLQTNEPRAWAYRRMHSAMTALAALHPRDEIEIMIGVQALSAYQAATACWHIGMNIKRPAGDGLRHITVAATAARTFDSMLRALERRQAKPLAVPIGRPPSQPWPETNPVAVMVGWEDRCRQGEDDPDPEPRPDPLAEVSPPPTWSPEDLAVADQLREADRIEEENQGLDIANTEGILPGGGMIMPQDPTPQQAAYIARRLALMYKREYAESLAKGIDKLPKIRPLRTGDRVP